MGLRYEMGPHGAHVSGQIRLLMNGRKHRPLLDKTADERSNGGQPCVLELKIDASCLLHLIYVYTGNRAVGPSPVCLECLIIKGLLNPK